MKVRTFSLNDKNYRSNQVCPSLITVFYIHLHILHFNSSCIFCFPFQLRQTWRICSKSLISTWKTLFLQACIHSFMKKKFCLTSNKETAQKSIKIIIILICFKVSSFALQKQHQMRLLRLEQMENFKHECLFIYSFLVYCKWDCSCCWMIKNASTSMVLCRHSIEGWLRGSLGWLLYC